MINKEDLEDIVKHAEAVQIQNNPDNDKLLDIYDGNLKQYVEESMSVEFAEKAFESARQRIAPINVLRRTTDKLAKVYSQGVERSATNETDNNLISDYEELLDLNNKMSNSDSMVNLLRSVAFEPYIQDGTPKMRVLTANEFTVWSNDDHDKTNPTVFIKFFGVRSVSEVVKEQNVTRQVNVYILYDKDEFIKIDAELNVMDQQPHDYGRIPFTYMNLSISKLVPSPDRDSLCMTILIPKLLSDLNYASKYQSHGIRYGIDVDVNNLDGNPDTFWEISSKDTENAKPEIGVIAPSVDIDKVLNLTKEELVMYLEARSLKVGASGKFDTNASGFAKLIDSADVTDVRKENMHMFKAIEMDLWSLLSIMHNIWVENEEIDVKDLTARFSSEFVVSIKYGDMTPIVDPQEKRDNLKFKLENKLTTYERAVRESNPDLTKDEQDQLLEELAVEQKENIENNEELNDPGNEDVDKDSKGADI